jgi:hypothetical protein
MPPLSAFGVVWGSACSVRRRGLAEVKLSQLANDRASDMKVKDFARRMITDHTQANNELKPIAESFPCLASWREKAKWHTIGWPNGQVSNLIENT